MGNMGNLSREQQEQLMLQRRKQAYLMKKRKKEERKRQIIKIAIFILVFVVVFALYQKGLNFKIDFSNFKFEGIKFDLFKKKDKKTTTTTKSFVSDLEGQTIAYVPIDDRSIHTTRMEYLAQSMGYELQMPTAKYYTTHIDRGENSYATYNTKYGNPSKISSWLLEQEKEGCNYYIISLDQMFSGGLVGSQYLTDDDLEIYEEKMDQYKKTINDLLNDKDNHIYLIDSVVGLSPTAGFLDITEEDEQDFIEFSNTERKQLSEDSLKINKIVKGYTVDKNNKDISGLVDEDKLEKFINARKRKLKYSNEILDMIADSKNKNQIHIYYGIDGDGNNSINIQRNDIAYIKKIAKRKSVNIVMHEGVSTLSEIAFADMVLDSISNKVQVKVTYYGNPDRIVAGTAVDYKSYMNSLLKDLGIRRVDTKPDFEILVYNSVEDAGENEQNTNDLLNQYLNNIRKKIPTVIINDAELEKDRILIRNLSDYDKTKVPLGYLIGYSNWNGFINSSRLGVAQGATRIVYLKGTNNKKENADKGFLRAMTFSYVDDMGYIALRKTVKDQKELEKEAYVQEARIIKNLNKCNYISNMNSYEEKGVRNVSTYNYSSPWSRIAEVDFDVSAAIKDKQGIRIPSEVIYVDEQEDQ